MFVGYITIINYTNNLSNIKYPGSNFGTQDQQFWLGV